MKQKKIYIIDFMALAYRSFFAFARTTLSTKDGMQTGAILGSAMFLNKIIQEDQPNYIVAAAESMEPTARREQYEGYKAHRDEMPDGLGEQLPFIEELLQRWGIPLLRSAKYEADDVIATLATQYAEPQRQVFIISGDKDFMQIVNEQIVMLAPKKNEEMLLIDRQGVIEKFHCPPEQVIDCLALMGDTSDNVPGVPGIGEKTAGKLIAEFGNLENLYDNLDQIKSEKQRLSLQSHRKEAFLSRDLVTLNKNVPLKFNLEDAFFDEAKRQGNPELLKLYNELEFRQLAKKLAARLENTSDWLPVKQKATAKVSAVHNKNLLATIEPQEVFAFAINAEGVDSHVDGVLAIDIQSTRGAQRCVLAEMSDAERQTLRAAWENPHLTWVTHDLKAQLPFLWNTDWPTPARFFDTMVGAYLLDPEFKDHSLERSVERLTQLNLKERHPTAMILALYESVNEQLNTNALTKVYWTIEMPLIPILARMEYTGVYIDTDFLNDFSNELATKAEALQRQIYTLAGREFNIQSTKQLQEILFTELKIHEQLGIKRLKKTKTGISTDESVLSAMTAHPLVQAILDYREVMKLKNTYVDPLPQHVHYKTGRLHTTFRQTGTATGRLSSDNPNLQNIPMYSELGQRIRQAFVPQGADSVIVSADYMQVELRLLAIMAKEDQLIAAFKAGEDIHKATAARIFNVPLNEVTSTMRSQAKAINFGIIYGMGPLRLAKSTNTSIAAAKDFMAKYFAAYPGIKVFTQSLLKTAQKLGYSTTIVGRRRYIRNLNDANAAVAAHAMNVAVNAPIQGSAADLIKLAMIRIDQNIRAQGLAAHLILQVHDELVFECPKRELAQLTAIIRDGMENALPTTVPFEISLGSGPNWWDAH